MKNRRQKRQQICKEVRLIISPHGGHAATRVMYGTRNWRFGVLEPYEMSGVPDSIISSGAGVVVLEPYEMSGVPDAAWIYSTFLAVLEPYEMSGVPDAAVVECAFGYVLETYEMSGVPNCG